MIYCDTSFIVSFYQKDANSMLAASLFTANPDEVAVSMFHDLELTNGLELRVFRGKTTVEDVIAAEQMIENDFASGLLKRIALGWNDVFAHARILAQRHTRNLGTRSLDIFHVASALELGLQRFYTFDKRQADLARAEGLQVFGC